MIKLFDDKKGKFAKVFSLVVIVSIFFLAISISLKAQNETNFSDENTTSQIVETINNTVVENSTNENPEMNDSNISLEINSSNGAIENLTDEFSNQSDILSETQNETTSLPSPEQLEENTSGLDNALGQDTTQKTVQETPQIEIEINIPEKITRGNDFEISASVSNTGVSDLKKFSTTWNLPEGLEVVNGKQTENNNNILAGETKIFTIKVQSLASVSLGNNEIKFEVLY